VYGPHPDGYLDSVHVNGQHPAQLLRDHVARNRPAATSGSRWHWQHADPGPTAFVLAGGGNRGAYQIGMLRALAERGITADIVVGCSVGAINAVSYASKPTIEGVHLAGDMWRRLTGEYIFTRDRLHGTWRFLAKRESVFSTTGLQALLDRVLRFERIEDASIPLVLVATRARDAAEHWFTTGPAATVVLASSALPAVFPPVEVDGERFVDGGIVNNAPISVALSAGARRIFLLLCSNVRHRFAANERPIDALTTAFDMGLAARLRRDLATIGDQAEVIVLEPEDVPRPDWQDFSQTGILIEAGYAAARDILDAYFARSGAAAAADNGSAAVAGRGSGRRKKVSR
jgi:NTE family protein